MLYTTSLQWLRETERTHTHTHTYRTLITRSLSFATVTPPHTTVLQEPTSAWIYFQIRDIGWRGEHSKHSKIPIASQSVVHLKCRLSCGRPDVCLYRRSYIWMSYFICTFQIPVKDQDRLFFIPSSSISHLLQCLPLVVGLDIVSKPSAQQSWGRMWTRDLFTVYSHTLFNWYSDHGGMHTLACPLLLAI